jgi:tRNA(Ile)-lysidine synthase
MLDCDWSSDVCSSDLYARSRARRSALGVPAAAAAPTPLGLAQSATEHAGIITLDRARLRAAAADEARRFVALAAVCAGGGERLPATARTARVTDALRGQGPSTATLAGARIEAEDGSVRLFREPGEAARGGLKALRPPGVFDGRFEIASGAEVRRLSGLAGRLSPADRTVLRQIPAAARGALPVVVEADGSVRLAPLESLVGARLRAAAGLVQREPA